MPDYRKLAEPGPLPPSIGWGGAPEGMSLAALQQYLPQLNIKQQKADVGGLPRVGVGYEIPVGQGTLGVEGYYDRPRAGDQPYMGASLRYNRSF